MLYFIIGNLEPVLLSKSGFRFGVYAALTLNIKKQPALVGAGCF